MTYTIERNMPAIPDPAPLDITRVTATLKALDVGDGFTIPADELSAEGGKYLSSSVGQRIHQAARRLGIRVRIKKLAEGLRVRREK